MLYLCLSCGTFFEQYRIGKGFYINDTSIKKRCPKCDSVRFRKLTAKEEKEEKGKWNVGN